MIVSTRRRFVLVATLLAICGAGRSGHADSTETSGAITRSRSEHPNPRLKTSYRLFSISGLQGGRLWLNGAQIDAYALSRRWVRVGAELEGGGGGATFAATPVRLTYGLFGLTAGVQYPARVTPFVEGRFVGGVLHGDLQGTLTVGESSYGNQSATTWIYGGGVETGIEMYVYGRTYLSVGAGWMRSTWHGLDVPTMIQTGHMAFKNLTGDTFTLKVGIGI